MPDDSTPTTIPDLKIEVWAIGRPQPYPMNARIITDVAIDKVAASIDRFGWQQPIVVDDQGVVVVGHTRLLAAKKLKLKQVPVHVMRGVPQTRIDEYRLADNRTAQETLWDLDILAKEMRLLTERGVDLGATGFDEPERERYLANEATADSVAALANAERSRTGASGATITCPRCRKSWVRP